MLKTVFKVQLRALLRSMAMRGTSGKRKYKKLTGVLLALLMVYALGTLLVSFGTVFYSLCGAYEPMGLSWLYFATAAILAVGISVVFSIFMSQSLLFEAQDNELLLSMPIKPSVILGARICVLLLLEYVLSFFIVGVACGIYAYLFSPVWTFYLYLFAGWLLLPLFSAAISCFLGFLVSAISARMRNKSFFVVAVSLLLLGGYAYGVNALFLNVNLLVSNGENIARSVEKFLPPFYYFGAAIASFDIVSLLLLVIWCCLPFGLLYLLLSKSFIGLATTKVNAKKLVYKEKAVQAGSAFSAMLRKEIAKFLTTPMYLLNTGLAFLANIIFGVYFVIKGPGMLSQIFEIMPESSSGVAVPLVIVLLCAFTTLSFTTAPSISLEGRKLWILKSSPIATRDVFLAKVAMNLLFAYPTQVFAAVCSVYVLRPTLLEGLLLFLLPMLMQLFVAFFGLIANLFFPKFDFTNEVMVIKQSASVLVAMLGSFGVLGLFVLPYLLWLSFVPFVYYGLFVSFVLLLLSAGAYAFLITRGKDLYDSF